MDTIHYMGQSKSISISHNDRSSASALVFLHCLLKYCNTATIVLYGMVFVMITSL